MGFMDTIRKKAVGVLPFFAVAYVATLPWTWAIRSASSGRLGTVWTLSITVTLIALGLVARSQSLDWKGRTLRSILLSPWTWAIAILIWALLSLLWSLDPRYSLGRSLQLASLIAATWAVSQLSGKAIRVLLGTLAISTAGTAGVLLAQSGNNVRPWLGLMDPNTASFALLIGYVSAITVWTTASRLSTRIMGLAASAILISGIVLAASRSALLGLVLLYIAITVLVLLKKIKIHVFVIALMTIFWSTVVTSLFVGPFSDLKSRVTSDVAGPFSGLIFDRSIDFSDPAVADLNGRLQIWTQYLELVGDWGAKGYGLGIQAANVPGANFGNYDPHSVPLQLGVQLGVVGLSLWIIMVALFLRAALSCSHGHIAILMWIAIAPLALTTATADLAIFWVPFSLAGVCLTRGSDKATPEGDQGSSNIQYPIPQNQKISRVYKRYIRPRKN